MLLQNIPQYESLDYQEIFKIYSQDFSREFGERKFKKVQEKVLRSRSAIDLIQESFQRKIRPNSADIVSCILGSTSFMFSSPETLAMASLFMLDKWNDTANSNNYICDDNRLQQLTLDTLNACYRMKFKR